MASASQQRDGRRAIGVEGENDRRLAIECDGDRYHGPEKWSEDMARQRVLERAGWEVWRCFASRFVRHRAAVLDELLALLSEREIAPVGVSEGWISRHTEQRRWKTPSADPLASEFDESEVKPEASVNRPIGTDMRVERATRPTHAAQAEVASVAMAGASFAAVERQSGGVPGSVGRTTDSGAGFTLTSPSPNIPERAQPSLPLNGFPAARSSNGYALANFVDVGLVPNPELLYDTRYCQQTLRRMVGHVISVEGPIYADLLAVRIARAHGKERTGSTIQKLVHDAVDRRFPRGHEDDRVVFWPEGVAPDSVFPYRPAKDGLRSHTDTPLAELASLELPLIRVRLSDEVIIQKMADEFSLARLRQATRERFEAALLFAKRHLGADG